VRRFLDVSLGSLSELEYALQVATALGYLNGNDAPAFFSAPSYSPPFWGK